MAQKTKQSCKRRQMTAAERDGAHKLEMRAKKLERLMRKVAPGFIAWPSKLYKPNGEQECKRRRLHLTVRELGL